MGVELIRILFCLNLSSIEKSGWSVNYESPSRFSGHGIAAKMVLEVSIIEKSGGLGGRGSFFKAVSISKEECGQIFGV
jgi:hypothetical protein